MRLIRDGFTNKDNWQKYPGGHAYVRPVHDQAEHLRLLRSKLLEEVGELFAAQGEEEVEEEAADVLQVLRDYAHLLGVTWLDVKDVQVRKLNHRGGFTEGTVWDI